MSFETIADKTLEYLMDRIDEILGGDLDVDIDGGVLTVELASGGLYVINRHNPNRQIWLSSPLSGAHHFDYDKARKQWVSTRSDVTLGGLLEDELGTATKIPFSLELP